VINKFTHVSDTDPTFRHISLDINFDLQSSIFVCF